MMKVLLALSPSNLRGASSKVNVIKHKERSVVKFLITPYKELNDHLNNSKSSRGKITEWEKIFFFNTEDCRTACLESIKSLNQGRPNGDDSLKIFDFLTTCTKPTKRDIIT